MKVDNSKKFTSVEVASGTHKTIRHEAFDLEVTLKRLVEFKLRKSLSTEDKLQLLK